jgi:hypothetical protein
VETRNLAGAVALEQQSPPPARPQWQFREMNFTVFVDFSFNSNRVHIVDDTLQR